MLLRAKQSVHTRENWWYEKRKKIIIQLTKCLNNLTTPLHLPVTDSLLSVFKYSILWKDTSTNYRQIICKCLYKGIVLCNSSQNHLASFPALPDEHSRQKHLSRVKTTTYASKKNYLIQNFLPIKTLFPSSEDLYKVFIYFPLFHDSHLTLCNSLQSTHTLSVSGIIPTVLKHEAEKNTILYLPSESS